MPWKVTMKPLYGGGGKFKGWGHHKEWVPEPNKPAPVTLKPLVNKKGKVIGHGHFKGNEQQNTKAIPKSAPKTKAGKQKLQQAIAKTKTPIAKSAQKKQSAVLKTPKPKAKKQKAPTQNIPADKVTLKPLVNNKGKFVGWGHFKGNETQDLSKIPKKGPQTAAEKGQLMAAIAATPKGQITAGAAKKQAEVLPQNKKFNKYIKSKPTDGSAGDINQITADYMKEGGGAGLGTGGDVGLGGLKDTYDKQIQDLKDAQTKVNKLNKDALDATKAMEDAKLEEEKLLAKQKSMLGISSSAGKGGLKLGGLKTSGKASKASKRKNLSNQQLNLQASLADALKVFGGPNLG